ncbi:MAG TPA: DNA-directed RNA polymerase subunit alpha [Candidatus Cloacimonadota bacterium]|nr:DNA-directed RNA polymerase subunit alpha [Candidatus Cloacimonadota bacterium]HOQ79695.1 DNA-directed RNA polymerase subunit alpha [Candidatus Cloacimonadota bacterium]
MMLLEPLQMPTKIEFDKDTYSDTYGKFEIGPFEPGYATTIGNTLRRVLLSSIQGAAARFVKIEGLHHEFTPIPGCDADYVDFILNLKKLVLKSDTLNEVKLTLNHKGIGPITAGEIEETADIKVINKDLVLCNMTEDTELFAEIWVGQGRGYTPADMHNVDEKSVGVIPVDSIYSPITKVNFVTANQRVGERIDFDKLIVEIFTNGSIEPKYALYLSAKLLKDIYATLVLFEEEPDYIEEVEMDPELERLEKVLAINVKELELTVRAGNCLAAAKIETIGELVAKTEPEMLKYRNFGKKSLDEIKKLITNYDLTLGMDVPGILKRIEDAKNRMINIKKG